MKTERKRIVEAIKELPFWKSSKSAEIEASKLAKLIESVQRVVNLLFGRANAPILEDLPKQEAALITKLERAKETVSALGPEVLEKEASKREALAMAKAAEEASKKATEAAEANAKARAQADAIKRAKDRSAGLEPPAPEPANSGRSRRGPKPR